MKKRSFTLCFCISVFLSKILSQDTIPSRAFGFQASYIGDNVLNTTGGIKKGYNYLGLANITAYLKTRDAGLWKGGYFYINTANTHGGNPSAELIGDFQVASNIEAGEHIYLQELWYKHTFGKLELTAGLQDMNIEFANSNSSKLFLNSSLGILPTISANVAAPIFPLTTLGITFKWIISENTTWLSAVYDGCPTGFENNPHNLNWQLKTSDGLLALTEIHKTFKNKVLNGTYKLGFFTHNHLLYKTLGKLVPDSLYSNIFGVYTYADQSVWQNNHKNITVFIQLGISPVKSVANSSYFGCGFNYYGLFNKQGNDILGLAIACEKFNKIYASETAIELTYQYTIHSRFFIQPDFQYIINPSGTVQKLPNSLVANLRFGFNF